ncbi:MAG TPA: NTP transferase domain-containing protein [Thermoanaerobaculia bacterium]
MRPAGALLAAGAATRFGRPKALLEIGGKSFLRRLADELAAVAAPVLVVAPPGAAGFAAALAGSAAEILVHPAPQRGLGSSLALAAREVRERGPRPLLVALVDQPLAGRELFARLVAAAENGSGWAASDYGGGPIGPPAVFPSTALTELAALDGDRGARHLLARERHRLALVAFPGGRYDVDMPADLARLTKLGTGTGEGS